MGVTPLSHCKDQVGHNILKRQETTVDPNLSKPNAPSALKGKNLSTKDFYDGPFALVGMGNSPNKLESMTVNYHWRKNLTVTRRGKRRLLPRDDQSLAENLKPMDLLQVRNQEVRFWYDALIYLGVIRHSAKCPSSLFASRMHLKRVENTCSTPQHTGTV
ncbi:hypothetical protein DM01DRAFT_1101497 [Hesseltinella vesiculosa]|uniref:Uncharacterized protein n=1 Tax=Hesseltinella vesiculosa TaxID=101127 RepID=A0A1X2GBB2_9FUNG|nr:hypothetical protein DM01DRAFT_1101497 [Hesseltinella vesiculosa]